MKTYRIGSALYWYDRMFRVWYVGSCNEQGELNVMVESQFFFTKADAIAYARELNGQAA